MKSFRMGLLLLVLAVSVAVLAACGGSGTEENTVTSNNQEQGSPAKEEDSAKPKEEDPAPATTEPKEEAPDASPQQVKVSASNWEWKLDATSLKAGVPVEFHVEGVEGIHGFKIVGTDINEKIEPGKTVKVTWTPEQAGEYTIKCSISCGPGHGKMEAKFTVQ